MKKNPPPPTPTHTPPKKKKASKSLFNHVRIRANYKYKKNHESSFSLCIGRYPLDNMVNPFLLCAVL